MEKTHNFGWMVVSVAAAIVLLVMPVLAIVNAPTPKYLVDFKELEAGKALPEENRIVYKGYLKDENTVLILTKRYQYEHQDSDIIKKKTEGYLKHKQHNHRRERNMLMSQAAFFCMGYYPLVFLGLFVYHMLRSKKGKDEERFFSPDGTVFYSREAGEACLITLIASLVVAGVIYLQWGKFLMLKWTGDAGLLTFLYVTNYMIAFIVAGSTLLECKYKLVIDHKGIRGRCPKDETKSSSFIDTEIDIRWDEVDHLYMANVEKDDNKDAYKKLVIKCPKEKRIGQVCINLNLYDEEEVMECLRHYCPAGKVG